jgi:hypothetical protein
MYACWCYNYRGWNDHGVLGSAARAAPPAEQSAPFLKNITSFAAGARHCAACALPLDGAPFGPPALKELLLPASKFALFMKLF